MPSVSLLERQPSASGSDPSSSKKPRTMGATAGSSAATVINSSPGQLRSLLAPYSSGQSPPPHDASLPHHATSKRSASSGRPNSRRPSVLPPGVAKRDVDAGSSSSDDIDSPKVRRGLDAKGRPMTETGGPRSGMGSGKRSAEPNPSVLRDDMGAEADVLGLVARAGLNEAQAEAGAAKDKKGEKVGGLTGGKMASVPATTRVDPSILQRIDPDISLSNAWQLLPFLAGQANTIASSFVSHHLFGPPKKSWGIEMTIFTAIVRSAASFSHLSSIDRLRRMLDLGQILPTPKDGIITPVSFKVKRRNLRGFLRSADRAEDGTREITGEWVVSKRLWKRMQTEHAKRLAAAAAAAAPSSNAGGTSEASDSSKRPSVARKNSPSPLKLAPDASSAKDDMAAKGPGLGKEKVILYLHGGAYFVMSAATHRPLTISVAKYTECRLFAVNYRLAPETKFPGALHDAVASYFRLIYDLKIPPENIVVAGDSAGGGLSVALLMYLRDEGYPLPCGAILQSPWSDLTMSCDSWDSNMAYDYLPMPKQDDPLNPVKCYLGEEGVHKYITHPYASPLFGDFHGLPPMLVQVGDAEVLRDEVTLLAHKASLHGVQVEHELYEDCVHVFQAFLFLEASRKALQSQRHFIRRTLPQLQAEAEANKERKKAKGPKAKPSPSDESIASAAAKQPAVAALQKPATEDSDSDAGATVRRSDSPMPPGRGDGGAVDAEISSDAHLVAEGSRPHPESLPATPRLSTTSLTGAGAEDIEEDEDEDEDEDEQLSTPEAEREAASLDGVVSAAAAEIASGQRVKASSAPPQAETATTPSASPPASAEASLWSGLSLRGRLPPAMDISTLQSLFMSKSQPGTPAAAAASASRRGSIQNMTTAEPSTTGPSSGAATPSGAHHRRSESVGHSLDIYKLAGDDLRPRAIKGRLVGSHPDLKALLDSYNESAATPGAGLRTTVYRQGDQPDPDDEEYGGYFRGAGGKKDAEGEDGTKTPASAEGDEDEPQYAFESPGYGFV